MKHNNYTDYLQALTILLHEAIFSSEKLLYIMCHMSYEETHLVCLSMCGFSPSESSELLSGSVRSETNCVKQRPLILYLTFVNLHNNVKPFLIYSTRFVSDQMK